MVTEDSQESKVLVDIAWCHINYINIYYSMSGRAAQENIQFKAGSIGPTIGRANTEAKNRIFSCTAQAKECNYDSTQSATPIPVR